MRFHRNAKLGLAGRRELVLAIAAGGSMREAAATFNVSVATVHRWWGRWSQASEQERRSLSCLLDRSSRPTRSPRRLAPEAEQAICECRRKTGWGPRLVAGATGFAHSTVWKVLRRFGLSRPAGPAREPANSIRVPVSGRPAAHGRERVRALQEARSSGDGRSALAGPSPRRHRPRARGRRRPLPPCLRRDPLRCAGGDRRRLPRARARLLRRPRDPCPPPDDGRSHRERARALPHWLDHYNQRRPHSSLGGRRPISRVHNGVWVGHLESGYGSDAGRLLPCSRRSGADRRFSPFVELLAEPTMMSAAVAGPLPGPVRRPPTPRYGT